MTTYLPALDQGTSSSRSIVFDTQGRIVASAQLELPQIYPQPGWVEHDPREIWRTQLSTAKEALAKAGLKAGDIRSVGITNQRETTIVWNRKTGAPIHHGIVWQDRRAEPTCVQLREAGHSDVILRKPACASMPIFRAPNSNGCWTTCPAHAPQRRPASWPSARWIAG
jgi:glycerol kinase